MERMARPQSILHEQVKPSDRRNWPCSKLLSGLVDAAVRRPQIGGQSGTSSTPTATITIGQTAARPALSARQSAKRCANGRPLSPRPMASETSRRRRNPIRSLSSQRRQAYSATGTALSGAAAATYATSGSLFTVTAQAATDKPLIIEGAASQSGNLTE